MTVVVKKLGGSIAVVIPKAIAREMELAEGAILDINASDGGILLRKRGRRPRRPMSELVAQMSRESYAANNRDLLGDLRRRRNRMSKIAYHWKCRLIFA